MEDFMNLEIKKHFLEKWEKHFPGSEMPIVCQYIDEITDIKFPSKPKPNPRGYTCIFSQLAPVRKGRARAFNTENLGCWGASITLGFQDIIIDEARDFLINVERYKKTGDLVDKISVVIDEVEHADVRCFADVADDVADRVDRPADRYDPLQHVESHLACLAAAAGVGFARLT